jgi:hypothetical protein
MSRFGRLTLLLLLTFNANLLHATHTAADPLFADGEEPPQARKTIQQERNAADPERAVREDHGQWNQQATGIRIACLRLIKGDASKRA